VRLADDLVAIPVPGHTRGSMALLHGGETLFSGDHLWWEDDGLWAERSVCWWSWSEQRRSVRKLLGHDFRRVLPGHGGRHDAGSAAVMRAALERLIVRLG
jgi:glyoxylase-like metal-dependent hydrolase (beta-lactamase superfamily II)